MDQTPIALTHKRVLSIAIPIVLANITVPILGAVDTGVIGQLGLAAPIGAVGIGALILSTIYWVFGFLRMGTTGLTAQALGAGENVEVRALLKRGLMIGFVGGLIITILQAPLFLGAFYVSPASPEVEEMARDYMQIRIFGAPAAIAMYGLTGWLIANEKTRAVLVLQLWMNGLNIGLDLLFVLGFGWGVEGVAIATLIAEWTGLALGLWLVRDGLRGGFVRSEVLNRARLINMFNVNSDILIRSLLLEAGFVSFLFLGAGLGDATLAANHVLLQFLHIVAYALDGFAFAAEALVGRAIGRRDLGRLRRSVFLTSIWGGVIVVSLALIFAIFGNILVAVMAKSLDVQRVAAEFMPWVIAAPLIGGASWMLDGIFIGATRTKDMRNMMFISVGIYAIALWLLLPPFGNHGLWLSLMVFYIARGVTLGLRYPALEKSVA